MNIALCHESVNPARGGCETYIVDLLHRLAADRHEVHIYASEWDDAAVADAAGLHKLPRCRGPRFLRPWRFGAACEAALRRARHDVVVGFVKTWHQDVIIPQGGLHVASADYNLRKHASSFRRGLARVGKWLDPCSWSYARLERKQFVCDRRQAIVAPSHLVKNHFEQYYGINGQSIWVIPNAIDPARFAERHRPRIRLETRAQFDIAPGDMVGLFVGHNYRLKGLDPLLHAVRDVPPWVPFKLLACGSAKTGRYQRLAAKLGIEERVRLVGFQKDVRPCFFAADFLVHPTFYDPCSLVVLEALACGLPVLTTRHNGAAELLHPPNDGFIVDDPHDHRSLAIRIEQLCDRRHHAARVQAARQTAAAWTFEDHYEAVLTVLQAAARMRQAA